MTTIDDYRQDIPLWAADHFMVDRRHIGGRWIHQPGRIVLSPYQADVLREAGRDKYSAIVWSEPGKSGKSTVAGLLALHTALHQPAAEVYCVANDLRGTGRVFNVAKYCIKHNRALRPTVTKNEIRFRDGYIQAVAADYRGESGSDPSLVVFDEVEHYMYGSQERLVAEFKTSPTRASSKHLYLGYGGWSGESDIWQSLLGRRESGTPALTHIVNSDGSPAVWDCGGTLVFYSDVLRQAWQTPQWVAAQEQNLTPADFKRIVLNQFVPISSQVFVQPEWWQACYDPALRRLQPGDKDTLILALDLAMGGVGADTIALVAVARYRDGVAVRYAQAWESDGGRFDYTTTVMPVIRWLVENFSVAQLCYDVFQAQHLANTDLRGLCWLEEFSQQKERDIADKRLYDLIVSRSLRHYNDETLNSHIQAAGANVKGDNRIRIVKAGRRKIDLVVALSMAAHRCMSLNLPDSAPVDTRQKSVAALMADHETANEAYERLKQARNGKNDDSYDTTGKPARFRYIGNFGGSFSIMTTTGPQLVRRDHIYEVPSWVAGNIASSRTADEWKPVG